MTTDATNAWLSNRLRHSDSAFLKRNFGSEESSLPAAFKKELEFEFAFAKAGGLLLAGLDPTGMGGVIAGFGDQRRSGIAGGGGIHSAGSDSHRHL